MNALALELPMSEPTDEKVQATSLEELLQLAAKDLRNAFDRAAQVKHHGERGRLRETQVLDFLAERLPTNYSVGTGQVADALGSVSGQMDGLVFHAASSPKLYTEKSSAAYQPGIFFIESVAAVISVKSRLDKKKSSSIPLETSHQQSRCQNHATKVHQLSQEISNLLLINLGRDNRQSALSSRTAQSSQRPPSGISEIFIVIS
jgi:uncharacterized protein DUF6602